MSYGEFITLHGPDGSGKTTTAVETVRQINSFGVESVFFGDWVCSIDGPGPNPFSENSIKQRMDEEGTPSEFLLLQVAKVAWDSSHIDGLVGEGVTVLKDRGIYDVRSDLVYRGIDPDATFNQLIREPDGAFFLDVGEAMRRQRLATKTDIEPEDWAENKPGTRMYHMARNVLEQVRCGNNGTIIDSTNRTLHEVSALIVEKILERRDNK